LIIQNSGGSNLNWKISSSANWLNFDPSEGSISAHSSSTIEVSVNINGMATGSTSTTFRVEAAENNPQTIFVNLIVYEKKFAQGPIISEVQIAGEKTSHDFIELYNPTSSDIYLGNYNGGYFKLIKRTQTGTENINIKSWRGDSNAKISSQGYYLWASSEDGNYPSSIDAEVSTKENISQNNGIGLILVKDNEETIIDAVGWGDFSNVLYETSAFPQNPEANKSLGRKIAIDDNENPNYLDLDNNRLDFDIQTPTPGEQNENLPPIAQFKFSPENPYVGDNISFNASASWDDGNIVSYIWDFGDGSSTSATTSQITKFFSTSSTFKVSLSVVDNLGVRSTNSTTTQISVRKREPLSIVINEVAWAGTRASSSDEWIELYNNTTSTINIVNWSIFRTKTGNCLNFSETNGTTTISPGGYLIYAARQDAVKNENNQTLVDLWDDKLKMATSSPGKLTLRDVPNCQEGQEGGDLIDTIGEETGEWFAGNATDSISMERISATTTGATSTNWANNNLITRNGLDAGSPPNKINGTPKAKNSVSISPTTIFSLPFDEFSEITLTYLGSPYLIQSDLTVPSTNTLKIEPSVELKFKGCGPSQGSGPSNYNNANLIVNGKLLAVGKENQEIIFTSISEPSGSENWWGQIYFASSSQGSILEYVRIENGGKKEAEPYLIIVDSTSITFASSTLENFNQTGLKLVNSSSTIENLKIQNPLSEERPRGTAIRIFAGSPTIRKSIFKNTYSGMIIEEGSKATIEGNYFEGIQYEQGAILVENSTPILRNNSGEDNKLNGIYLLGSASEDWTLYPNNDFPYIILNFKIASSSQVTIEPGVVIKFEAPPSNSRGKLEVEGKLFANGSADNQIIFTSIADDEYGGDTDATSSSSLYWDYIHFSPGSEGSFIKNAIIRYGGIPSYKGAVYIQEARVELRDNIFENNGHSGITLYIENASTTIVANSRFENCNVAIKIIGECPDLSGLTFTTTTYPFCKDEICSTSTVSVCQ
jgi:hypothetical protein